ncbi:Histone acetyltransferase [Bertholletia excelsa]
MACDERVPPLPPPAPDSLTAWFPPARRVNSCILQSATRCTPARTVHSCGLLPTNDLWERLFKEGYRADVGITTSDGGIVHAHASVLGMASPVLKSMLKEATKRGRQMSISIHGVPHEAVEAFIRFLYSPNCEPEDREKHMMHLLVLSHAYAVPHLKQVCERHFEQKGSLTIDNLVDVLQLALLCDASRLKFICHRLILDKFQDVSATDGWKAMQQSHPRLEKQLLQSVVEEETMREQRRRRMKERKIYLQLYEAMEALVHIYRDGCRTIGPHDKDFEESKAPCKYAACKTLESLVRHYAGCKMRVAGGCMHCKRMWKLLELHSHLCADSDSCRVPLCRKFKQRTRNKKRKDDIKWRVLVQKILRTKSISGAPLFSMERS